MKNRRVPGPEGTEKSFLCSVLAACSGSILFLLLFSSAAIAHEVRPAYLELRQTGPETYDVFWKVPGRGEDLRLGLYVELPGTCTNVTQPRGSMINNAFSERWTVKCAGGLIGGTIHIAGLNARPLMCWFAWKVSMARRKSHESRPPLRRS